MFGVEERVNRMSQDGCQVESVFEAPSGFGEVAVGVLGEANGVVAAIQRTLDRPLPLPVARPNDLPGDIGVALLLQVHQGRSADVFDLGKVDHVRSGPA